MIFYSLPYPCGNCNANTWHKDLIVDLKTRGRRSRFSCVYCGEDVWPGGALRPSLMQQREQDERNRKEFEQWVSLQSA